MVARRVVEGLFDPYSKFHSLYELSKSANTRVDQFLADTSKYRMNILMTDFPEETDIVERSRMLNLMNCNDDPLYRKPNQSGQNCRSWASQCNSNSTVAKLCPMTCGLCKQPVGQVRPVVSLLAFSVWFGFCDRRELLVSLTVIACMAIVTWL